jgi:hypothetical protein
VVLAGADNANAAPRARSPPRKQHGYKVPRGRLSDVHVSVQGVVTLLQHPEQLAQLKADPSLVNNMVEELLRVHTASALATRRVAKVDVPFNGQVRTGTFHPFACSRLNPLGPLVEVLASSAHSTLVFKSVYVLLVRRKIAKMGASPNGEQRRMKSCYTPFCRMKRSQLPDEFKCSDQTVNGILLILCWSVDCTYL